MIFKYHIPVLLNEVMAGLKIRPGGRYIDATVGDGGHTGEILKRGGMVLGLDRDPEATTRTGKRFEIEIEKGRLILMRSNFDKLVSSLAKFASSPSPIVPTSVGTPGKRGGGANFANFDGILFDLGMSSGQIEGSGRGFSFQRDEPLDMRMDPDLAVTAADLVNGLGRNELYELFNKLAQVERARAVAEAIVQVRRDRPIKTTAELSGLVEKVLPRRGKLHPATKVFMGLRMAVNDELGSLERALPQAVELLAPGGRLAVISFHEGEDRIVKRFLRQRQTVIPAEAGIYLDRFRVKPGMTEINKKPIMATEEEIEINPRARSAKLRIGERRDGLEETEGQEGGRQNYA